MYLSRQSIVVVSTVLVLWMILNSPRMLDVIGSITAVSIGLFIIVLNTNPDILVQLSVAMISVGSQWYRYGTVDSEDDQREEIDD